MSETPNQQCQYHLKNQAMAILHLAVAGKDLPEGSYVINLDGMVQVSWLRNKANPREGSWICNLHVSQLTDVFAVSEYGSWIPEVQPK